MAPDPEGAWEQAAEVGTTFEAELMALRLRESGIEAQVIDQTFRMEPLPNVRNFSVVRVVVPAARLADAKRVLSESRPLPSDAEEATDGDG